MSGVSNTQRLRALIKAARDANGLSYDEIARRSKTLGKSYVYQLATQEHRAKPPSNETLEALALGLGVSAQRVMLAAYEDAGLVVILDESLPDTQILIDQAKELTPEQRQRWVKAASEILQAIKG